MGKEIAPKKEWQILLKRLAGEAGLEPAVYWDTIKRTVLSKKRGEPTNEETVAFLMVCDRYKLDPFLKQIHGFVGSDGQVVPMVGVDGWVSMALRHPEYKTHHTTMVLQDPESKAIVKVMENLETGMRDLVIEPEGAPADLGKCMPIYSVTMFEKKDGSRVIGEPEWYSECYRNTGPWNGMPRRQLAHKSFSQGARKAFGFSGIYDEDEARDILSGARDTQAHTVVDTPPEGEDQDDRALPGPVAAGNVDEHVGHEGELGAAARTAEAAERAADPVVPNAELPEVEDDPGNKKLGELEKKDYDRIRRRVHAVRKEAGYNDVESFNKAWKPAFQVDSLRSLKLREVSRLTEWIEAHPAAPAEPEAEAAAAPEDAAPPPAKRDDDHTGYLESMREAFGMFPTEAAAVFAEMFPNADALTGQNADRLFDNLPKDDLVKLYHVLDKRVS